MLKCKFGHELVNIGQNKFIHPIGTSCDDAQDGVQVLVVDEEMFTRYQEKGGEVTLQQKLLIPAVLNKLKRYATTSWQKVRRRLKPQTP